MKAVSSRTMTYFVACLAVLLAGSLRAERGRQGTGQQPVPTFRVQIEYVQVDAVVRDQEGHFVADLRRDDFEILEDGKRQAITTMALIDVPVDPQPVAALIAGRRFESDVVSNDEPPGRVYLIVLDDLHVSPQRTPAAKKIAKEFIERNLAPNDVAAVVTTTGARNNAQDFTSNRRLLVQAVDRFVGRKIMSPGASQVSNTLTSTDPNAVEATGLPGVTTAASSDPGLGERVSNARSSLETLAQLATLAGTIRNRRKALVLVGEGIDYRLGAPGDISGLTSDDGGDFRQTMDQRAGTRALREDLRRFVDAANRANVTLYAIDPRIYAQGGEEMVDIASGVTQNTRNDHEASNLGTLADDLEAAQDNLRTMSVSTGGFAVTGSLKAAQRGYDRIREDNSRYYILGYYPTNDKRDGKFRKIEVRVKRPGVEIVARKGYQAPKGQKPAQADLIETKEGTSAPLRDALMSVLSTPGLPITVAAAPFRGTGGNASVLVMLQTPPGAVKFVEKDGKAESNLELSFVAVDDKGKARGGEHLDVTMPLRPETRALVERTGLLVQSRMVVPPGRYVLRAGARDSASGQVGAVHCDLEIPDFTKEPLSMSGIVIASAQTALPNPRPDKELTNLLPGSPAVIRDFNRSDEIGMLVEIYDTKLNTPHDIDIITTIVGEDGKEAYRHEDRRTSAEVQGMQGAFGYLLNVRLADMTPGAYLLRVEARSRLDVDRAVARETTFKVR